jgi:hypothetical protein
MMKVVEERAMIVGEEEEELMMPEKVKKNCRLRRHFRLLQRQSMLWLDLAKVMNAAALVALPIAEEKTMF